MRHVGGTWNKSRYKSRYNAGRLRAWRLAGGPPRHRAGRPVALLPAARGGRIRCVAARQVPSPMTHAWLFLTLAGAYRAALRRSGEAARRRSERGGRHVSRARPRGADSHPGAVRGGCPPTHRWQDSPGEAADWPVDGLLVHTAGQRQTGFRIVDVWESEEAARSFGEKLVPVLQDLGITDQPEMYVAHTSCQLDAAPVLQVKGEPRGIRGDLPARGHSHRLTEGRPDRRSACARVHRRGSRRPIGVPGLARPRPRTWQAVKQQILRERRPAG